MGLITPPSLCLVLSVLIFYLSRVCESVIRSADVTGSSCALKHVVVINTMLTQPVVWGRDYESAAARVRDPSFTQKPNHMK